MIAAVFEAFGIVVEAVTDAIVYPLLMLLTGCFAEEKSRGRKPA